VIFTKHSRCTARVLRAAAAHVAVGALLFAANSAIAAEPAGGGSVSTNQTVTDANGIRETRTDFSAFWYTDTDGSDYRYHLDVSGIDPGILEKARAENWREGNWRELLEVYTADPGNPPSLRNRPRGSPLLPGNTPGTVAPDRPAMAGSYRLDGDVLRFEPQFPLTPGVTYVFQLRRLSPGGVMGISMGTFTAPDRASQAPTRISQVYPTADTLPDNLLKFYIHFSAAMRRGDAYRHIHLLDENGNRVDAPFLELGEELWSPDMTRLTLLLDPGRIKRGVTPNTTMGLALTPGHSHTLVIDADWIDANGKPLQREFRKTFRVTDPDRTPIDPSEWSVSSPKSGSRDPLVIDFQEPLDSALVQRLIQARLANGTPVTGTISLSDNERRWTLKPEIPWLAGPYQLVINTIIEDLAGNNIGKPFDVDVFEDVQRSVPSETVSIDFEVR